VLLLKTDTLGLRFSYLVAKRESSERRFGHLLLVHFDTLDRDERRACMRGVAVVSAEDGERMTDSRITCRRSSLVPAMRRREESRPVG